MTTTPASPPMPRRGARDQLRRRADGCSHNGERTSLDIMEIFAKPVIFSYANARALVDHL